MTAAPAVAFSGRPDHKLRSESMQETSKIWMNGELVDWADASVHVGAHGLHYGSGVFEGIRAYETPKGTSVFRLTEHMERLENSAKLLYMELPY
jgi:branched-chain amino acid aminotransferase